MPPTALLLGLLLAAAPTPPPGRSGGREELALSRHPLRTSQESLPGPLWHPLGESLDLRGARFPVVQSPRHLDIDGDRDGHPEIRVRGARGEVSLQTECGPYSVHLRREGERWFYSSGGELRAELAGAVLRLIDLDGDGFFGTPGVDALFVGERPYAGYFSDIILVGERLYQLELTEESSGPHLVAQPYTGPLAHLDVTSAFTPAEKLACAIFRRGGTFLDLAGKGAAPLPAGSYSLVQGRVRSGEQRARILPGRLPAVELAVGESKRLVWGGSLHAEFSYHVRGDELTVNPDLHFFDGAGAEYCEFAPISRPPVITVLNRATGKPVQMGRFGGCCRGGYTAWRGTVPAGLDLEVRIAHERPPFGTIEGIGRPDERR